KPKRVKDYAYHKEKMIMWKQAEQGVPLPAEQADWLKDTDEEIDEQELEAHYSYMAKIQEVSPEESSSTGQPLEQVQNHDENDVFANVRRHSEQPESINDTYVLEKDDSNVIPDSSNIFNTSTTDKPNAQNIMAAGSKDRPTDAWTRNIFSVAFALSYAYLSVEAAENILTSSAHEEA
ncbi:hypothetical protein Tco_0007476, partial [Tanacetum coccineum]